MKIYLLLPLFFAATLYGQAPIINSFIPTTAGPGDTVFINGNNFNGSSSLKIGGSDIFFNIISNSLIKAVIGGINTSGSVDVTNSSGTGSLGGFTFDGVPVIDSFIPRFAYVGDTITIFGKHIAPGWKGGVPPPIISFSGPPTNGYYISQQSYSKVTAVLRQWPFTDEVILQTVYGADTAVGLNVLEPPVLSIFNFTPKSGFSDTVVKINGSYFKHINITAIKFGNTPAASFTVNSDWEITAVVGHGETGPITIYSSSGNTESVDTFFYGPPFPKVISFSPVMAESGELISIAGEYFSDPATVTIGGVKADSIKVISPNLITARIPATANSGGVTVSTPTGTHSVTYFRFIYPVILCPPASSIVLNAGTFGGSYQWEVDTGAGYANISDNANYAGTHSENLQLINIPSSWYNYRYRCIAGSFYVKGYSLKFKNSWVGSQNTAWENPANWSCNFVPDSNTDVIVESGNIVINANSTIRTLIVKPGASVTVSAGVKLTIVH